MVEVEAILTVEDESCFIISSFVLIMPNLESETNGIQNFSSLKIQILFRQHNLRMTAVAQVLALIHVFLGPLPQK